MKLSDSVITMPDRLSAVMLNVVAPTQIFTTFAVPASSGSAVGSALTLTTRSGVRIQPFFGRKWPRNKNKNQWDKMLLKCKQLLEYQHLRLLSDIW